MSEYRARREFRSGSWTVVLIVVVTLILRGRRRFPWAEITGVEDLKGQVNWC